MISSIGWSGSRPVDRPLHHVASARGHCPASRDRHQHRHGAGARAEAGEHLAASAPWSSRSATCARPARRYRRGRSRKRRQGDDIESQPVEQVRAELAGSAAMAGRSACSRPPAGGHLSSIVSLPPTRSNVPYSTTRRMVSCTVSGALAISSRNSVPLMRQLEPPRPPPLLGAGEGARFMAEQLGFEQGLRLSAGTVQLDEGLVPARRQIVQAGGHQLLAGAALADYQHRACSAAPPCDTAFMVLLEGWRFGRSVLGLRPCPWLESLFPFSGFLPNYSCFFYRLI